MVGGNEGDAWRVGKLVTELSLLITGKGKRGDAMAVFKLGRTGREKV